MRLCKTDLFLFLTLLFLCVLGCGRSKSEFKPLGNGFGYVVYRGGIDVAPRESCIIGEQTAGTS